MSQPSAPGMTYHVPKGDKMTVQDGHPKGLNFQTFSGLRNFVCLEYRKELHNHQGQLERLDRSEATKCNERRLGSKDVDDMEPRPSRNELLEKIQAKLVEYDEFRLRSERIQTLATPTEQGSSSIAYNVLYDTQSIDHAEQEWLFQTITSAALSRDAGQSWIDEASAMFSTKEQEQKAVSEKGFQELSAYRLSIFRRALVSPLSWLLLFAVLLARFTMLPKSNNEAQRKRT